MNNNGSMSTEARKYFHDDGLREILGRLENVQGDEGSYTALCPAHDDHNPSLSISEGDGGRALVKCHAGCSTEDVVKAVGLTMADLSPESPTTDVVSWEIRDASGEVQAVHHRRDMPPEGKQVWWSQPDSTKGLNGKRTADLPLYSSEKASEWPPDSPIIVTEGEKAADALRACYLPAVGTVTGASGTPGQDALEVLRGRSVVLWPDNDDEGRRHMERLADGLQDVASEVRIYEWPEAPEKGDAADHPAVQSRSKAGVEELLGEIAETPPQQRGEHEQNRGFTALELIEMELPEMKWAIPGIIPEGVSILAGKPKLGKSWLGLGLCLATATGGYALGTKQVEQGESLYLALEDNRGRLQDRLKKMIHGEKSNALANFRIELEWPRLNEGGTEQLRGWLEEHPDTRLVMIDTLAKIRKPTTGQNVYREDYNALESLIPLAAEYGVAIVVVHHTNQGEHDDPLDEISGSTGLTGGVDTALVLKRSKGTSDANLYLRGRDVEEQDLALEWDEHIFGWNIVGDAAYFDMSDTRQKIKSALRQLGEAGPKAVAENTGLEESVVKNMMPKMAEDNEITRVGHGKYTADNVIPFPS